MIKATNILALFIVITMIACSKNEAPQNCIDDICIDGEWEWVQSYGTIAGVTITPKTQGFTRSLIIDNASYHKYEENMLIQETTYQYVKTGELETFTKDSLILKLDSGNWYAVFEEDGNLILLEPCADCLVHTYERK